MRERLFWQAVCVVALLAFCVTSFLFLWAGLEVGVTVVREISSYFGRSGFIVDWIPEELRQNAGDVASVAPLALVVLVAIRGALPTWFAQFGMLAFLSLMGEMKKLWRAGLPDSPRPTPATMLLSLLKPGVPVFGAAFLIGSYGTTAVPSRPPVTYVVAPDPMLTVLQIQPVVHFENAEIDVSVEPFGLTERGTTLDDARQAALQRMIEALRPCAASDPPVSIRPYGFASDDPFQGGGAGLDDSDRLNVEAANRRARSVYGALDMLARSVAPGVEVEAPMEWSDFDEMRRVRNSMIVVPDESARDPFADRVVLLSLTSTGACRSDDSYSRSGSPASTDTAAGRTE